jgi:CheY-like chemotaxis protein
MTAAGDRSMAETALIVDDDDDACEAIVAFLETVGYDVVAVNNARDALTLLKTGLRPRVIVLDLMMPGMDGWQFRAELLADKDLASIPVIVSSAAGDPVVRAAVAPTRAVVGITKPVDPEELLRLVGVYCRPGATQTR